MKMYFHVMKIGFLPCGLGFEACRRETSQHAQPVGYCSVLCAKLTLSLQQTSKNYIFLDTWTSKRAFLARRIFHSPLFSIPLPPLLTLNS